MKYYLLNILLLISVGIFLSACSDLQTNIPPVQKPGAHPQGFVDPVSANFHGKIISNDNWNMQQCQQCHAADFSGGTTGKSCKTCHTSTAGPEACNTCHGDFTDPSKIAPPRAVNGDSLTTDVTVGAHTQHLYSNTLSQVPCSSCHKVPASVYAEGHLNPGPDGVVFLSGLATAHGASNAAFNSSNATCSNTYCHGNFIFYKDSAASEDQFAFTGDSMTGNNVSVKWTQVDGTQAKCGSCHDLPPKGHLGYQQFPISSCVACHQGVVDEQGNIVDLARHVNGQVNVRGH